MAHFFREPDRRQRFLLPVDMMDWLPEGDIVHVVVDAVGLMDLSDFEATCKVGRAGQPPFAPAMLLALLIYAYSHGVRSSRSIERLCRRDAGYRFIVGDDVPDHSVIARFRQRHAERMKGVFLQVLELCREAGLIRLGLVALDGTKVGANASKHKALSWAHAERIEAQLRQEVQGLLALGAFPVMAFGSAVFEHGQWEAVKSATPMVWASLLWAGVVSSVLATTLLFWLVQRREAGRVTPYLLVTPVVSMLIGWGFMGDVLTPQILTGAALTLLGVAVVAVAERGLKNTCGWPTTRHPIFR